MYAEDDFLMLSGLQHFAYCRRQWALIHIEQQWQDNVRTVEGHLFHKTVHGAEGTEKRRNLMIVRGLRIKSDVLGIAGICDVVEFHKSPAGISLSLADGLWQPYPVEYKAGEPKLHDADELQLCAQAMCLEEMLLCSIQEGSLFYGRNRRRTRVSFSDALRTRVKEMTEEMHHLWEKGYTPKVKSHQGCNACSLKEICVPGLGKITSVTSYIDGSLAGK